MQENEQKKSCVFVSFVFVKQNERVRKIYIDVHVKRTQQRGHKSGLFAACRTLKMNFNSERPVALDSEREFLDTRM